MSEAASPLQPLADISPAEVRYLLGDKTDTISYWRMSPFLRQQSAMPRIIIIEVMTASTTAIISMLIPSLANTDTISVRNSQPGLTNIW